jgi:hypothetical protein
MSILVNRDTRLITIGLIGFSIIAYITTTIKEDDWDDDSNSGNYSPNAINLTREPSLNGGSKRRRKYNSKSRRRH